MINHGVNYNYRLDLLAFIVSPRNVTTEIIFQQSDYAQDMIKHLNIYSSEENECFNAQLSFLDCNSNNTITRKKSMNIYTLFHLKMIYFITHNWSSQSRMCERISLQRQYG